MTSRAVWRRTMIGERRGEGLARAMWPRPQRESPREWRTHARLPASARARSTSCRTRAERRLTAVRSSFVDTRSVASARDVASRTTLRSVPMSATSAMVRAGDVRRTPNRLATSSRRSCTVVVCNVTAVVACAVRGRRARGNVRCISCERDGANSYNASAVSCETTPPREENLSQAVTTSS
jgi:hypothetical protein